MNERKAKPQLNLDLIVSTAWKIVEEAGLDAFSTRRLARELGVKSPALYHHVPSMTALFGLMIDKALRDTFVDTRDLSWKDWLRASANGHRQALLAHRDSGRVVIRSAPASPSPANFFQSFNQTLKGFGFGQRDAAAIAGSLGSLVLGFVINEQQDELLRFAEAIMPVDDVFSFAIDLMIDGLECNSRADGTRRA